MFQPRSGVAKMVPLMEPFLVKVKLERSGAAAEPNPPSVSPNLSRASAGTVPYATRPRFM